MRIHPAWFFLLFSQVLPLSSRAALPTFQYGSGNHRYILLGRAPEQGGTTAIPTVVVPISLSFARGEEKPVRLDATPDVEKLINSPVFAKFRFPAGDETQYADAMLRATFAKPGNWHTLLARPEVLPTVNVEVPPADGYTLSSNATGGSVAVLDIEFVQREVFRRIGKQDGKLVIVVTHNAAYYTEGDATLCCSWGTHGNDSATGDAFVLGSYLNSAPKVISDEDVQPITQQLAEFFYDPQHDPLSHQHDNGTPGNHFPAWMRPASVPGDDLGRCGGTGVATAYFLLEPTDRNHKNNFPTSESFEATSSKGTYHVQNVALLSWYLGSSGDLGKNKSFPDERLLTETAKACPDSTRRWNDASGFTPTAKAAERGSSSGNGHELIGYWTGYGSGLSAARVSPQWDVIIVAFATPDKNSEGTLRFELPKGLSADQFKTEIGYLKAHARKVMISLGGGGQFFNVSTASSLRNFVSSVTNIVSEYGFEGIDIDFESPSLVIDAGDSDFRHPKTASIVNLIAGLRQLREHFGPSFLISLVPEGSQIPAGYRTYGGQFGSYLPIAYGIRDILSFMDVQDYNTPPLEGLDGEIYQAGSVDYHAAMTELVLHGFGVGGDKQAYFPALPEHEVAVGFLVGETNPGVVAEAMSYLITGSRPDGVQYRLVKGGGYPGMIGAMFWTIDGDWRNNYEFSNKIGPELRSFAGASRHR